MGEGAPQSPASRPSGPQSVLTPPGGLPAVPHPARPERAPVAGPPPAPPESARCRCGHPEECHRHYRAGTDCGVCGVTSCGSYRVTGGRLRRLLDRLGGVRAR